MFKQAEKLAVRMYPTSIRSNIDYFPSKLRGGLLRHFNSGNRLAQIEKEEKRKKINWFLIDTRARWSNSQSQHLSFDEKQIEEDVYDIAIYVD